jgi:L-asparaginase / beta-aspartyl-peptidase
MSTYAIAIHGGAGTILRSYMTPEKEEEYRCALEEALLVGEDILCRNGTALNAVEATVRNLENNALFNAGKGAVFTNEGKIELDASVMCGKTLMAGAVAGVQNVKNPVTLARTVMERSDYVFLSGKGAEDFAKSMQMEFETDEYFFSQHRYDQLLSIRESDTRSLDHNPHLAVAEKQKKFGTVGAVALDLHGDIAAATSTGGMTNKKYGRIGDSPVIGSGTYANNTTCGISCTGYGEYFLRSVVSYDVSCLMEYRGLSLKEACDIVVNHKLVKLGGEGGLIAVDARGHVETVFNSEGMYRARVVKGGERYIGIYRD